MSNRREFFKQAAGTAAGLIFTGCNLMNAAPQAAERPCTTPPGCGGWPPCEDDRHPRSLRSTRSGEVDEQRCHRSGRSSGGSP